MGSVTLETWQRFHDRVVARGSDWPRNLWFAAVEDGLSAALPAQSRLLVQYRQDVLELRELERTATGSYRDATRMAQLEAEIMRLIGIADQAIRAEGTTVGERREPELLSPAPARPRVGFWLGALILGLAMLCGALLGATYYHQQRMSERMERELVALQQRLIMQAADERAALQLRIRSADRVKESLDAIQAELRANVDEFNKMMSASLRSLSALGEGGIAERQLLTPERGLGEAWKGLRTRTATLERQLEQIEGSLRALAQRLPGVDGGVDRLAERLQAATTRLAGAESQVATIQAQAPELARSLEDQRQALARDLDLRRQMLGALGTEIASLQTALDDSRSQLAALKGSPEPALPGGQQDQERGPARAAARVAGVSEHAGIGTMQPGMQEQIDAVLAELADTADVAVRRSEDALKRAEAEAARRLEAVTEQAVGALRKGQAAQLAELSRWASATRDELEQTRAGLIAGWRGMDEAVAGRQRAILAELDQYAATLEVRVQEFLKALDVIVARSGG